MIDRKEPGPLHEGAGPRRRARLEAANIYLILEAAPDGRAAAEILAPALAGGVDVVQLRDKEADEWEIVEAARGFRSLCDAHGALLILNDRPDLALEGGADGVHVGQDDASVDEARALLGADALIGLSTHTPAQVDAGRDSLADYLGVGPIYATPTKPEARPVGEELVRHAADNAGKPFFAIGGIDASNAAAVAAAGADRIAVVRAIRDAEDPRRAAEELRTAIASGSADGSRE